MKELIIVALSVTTFIFILIIPLATSDEFRLLICEWLITTAVLKIAPNTKEGKLLLDWWEGYIGYQVESFLTLSRHG